MGLGVVLITGDPIGFSGEINPVTATGLAAALVVTAEGIQAKTALITVEVQQVRFRMDGTAPTATAGHVIASGGSYVVEGHAAIAGLKFIDTASGASDVYVTTFA